MRQFRPFGFGSLKSCSRVRARSQETTQEGTPQQSLRGAARGVVCTLVVSRNFSGHDTLK
ncbi:hypothetical protein E2C01_068588 [Portunus trituberculatus]|uniref:Uncharacterized protein n=1 Tax=Portunus trituberculatus TaxID=210409 RepID=A0A5B7HWK1_PORTR|nr:hypothetical protein [Portunus trituberculatus]